MNITKKAHWENVYETKMPNQVSWTQEVPKTSIDLLNACKLEKTDSIIDVGGGESRFVDYLIAEGYENITVLDISASALEKTQKRLGENANKVNWIVSDITEFQPNSTFDVWHDRATFHFLTNEQDRTQYLNLVNQHINKFMILGAFSEQGPQKCSGLEVQQYNELKLSELFNPQFELISCQTENHITPFETEQNFIFCSFKKNRLNS